MKPSQLFAVAVRVVGLISLIYVLETAWLLMSGGMAVLSVVRLVLWGLFSVYLLRGAPALVRFAYPRGED